MDHSRGNFSSIDEYIATFPPDKQALLEKMRVTIKAAAPEAQERISYQMPTFALHGNLVHFAAFKNHIGFYPGSNGIAAFQDELGEYEWNKGTIRFPLDKPLPLELVTKIVRFRVTENLERANAKVARKKA